MRILSVPLDSRPCTMLFHRSLAAVAGFSMLCPPEEFLGRYMTPGDTPEIFSWLEKHWESCDTALLSVEMLLYGGLVASRDMRVSDGFVQSRRERLRRLLGREKRPRVVLCSSVMRTMPTFSRETVFRRTADFASFMERLYEKSLERPEMLWTYFEEMEKSADAELAEVLSACRRARRRGFSVNGMLLDWLEEGLADFCFIGLDDVVTKGPNLIEKEMLQQRIDRRHMKNCLIYPGTDEMQMVAVAREACRHYGEYPSFSVLYSCDTPQSRKTLYEDRPLEDIVRALLEAAGVSENRENPQIYLFCSNLASGQREAFSQTYVRNGLARAFALKIAEFQRGGKPVAVADTAYANGADGVFARALLHRASPRGFFGYAAWNTASNTLGTVIAQSIVTWLGRRAPKREESERIRQEFLFERFADDWLYQSVVRPRLKALCMALGVADYNLGSLCGRISRQAEKMLKKRVGPLAGAFAGDYVFCGERYRIEKPFELSAFLPWPRIFEVSLRCRLRLHREEASARAATHCSGNRK